METNKERVLRHIPEVIGGGREFVDDYNKLILRASELDVACLGALRYLTGNATKFSERNKGAARDKLIKALGNRACPLCGNDASTGLPCGSINHPTIY